MCNYFYLPILRSAKSFSKVLFCFALFLLVTLNVHSESHIAGGFSHIIEVGRYSDYGSGYLTITADNSIAFAEKIDDENNTVIEVNNYTFEYIGNSKDSCMLSIGQLILEVDGESAAGWTKEDFYKRVDGRNDIIELKIRDKGNSGVYEFVTKIRPLYELPDSMKVFGNTFTKVKGHTNRVRRERENVSLKNVVSFEERSDEDFDFFPCYRYDYLITSNDPLRDKELLRELKIGIWGKRWIRDEKNPDILFTIASDVDESISSTYIPPSSRVVNDGSVTVTQYNYLTKRNDYITTQKNRTIHEGGYTVERKTADLFLEIAALDAKRLNDSSLTAPPIVWQGTAKRHVENPEINLNRELLGYASWMAPPPIDRQAVADTTIWAPVGVVYDQKNKFIVKEIIAGSRAEMIGLMPGDKIIRAEANSSNKYIRKCVKSELKSSGWGVLDYYLNTTYNIEILHEGKRQRVILEPVSIRTIRHYLVGAK